MSDNIVVDLTNYKERVSARVEPGTYRVQVEDVEVGVSQGDKTKGSTQVMVWFRIMGGEFDGANIIERLTLADSTMFRVVNFMQAIGLPTPKRRLQINARRWVGQVLDVELDDGTPYLGRVKSEVRNFIRVPASDRPQQGAAEDGLEEFATATTSNPAPAARADEDAIPSAAPRPSQETASEYAEEVDLDTVDL